MKRQTNYTRPIALLLAVIVTFVMMYFMLFTATNEIHKCTGADCPICHELQLAEGITKQINAALIVTVAAFFFMVICQSTDAIIFCPIQGRTLITDKVRMDH